MHTPVKFVCALWIATAAALISPTSNAQPIKPEADERRLALVIGNAAYADAPLKNPVNDAQALSASLKSLGFEVILRENTTLRDMIEAMRVFAQRAQQAHVRLVFYAGHGIQSKGRNYLLPVDAQIEAEEEFASKSGDVTQLLEHLGGIKHGVNIVVLDACRVNPFAGGTVTGPDGRRLKFRGVTPSGLARMDAPIGTFIAFSTAPGGVALDTPNAKHSLYTKHLLANINVPGMPIEQLFKSVRVAVAQETGRVQVPWESSSLTGDFCFKREGEKGCK